MAKHKSVRELPLPPRDSHPKFIAQEGWLEGEVAKAITELKISEKSSTAVEQRKRPFCVARCSRGGKTRALNELAHELRKAGYPVIFVTFNSWATLAKDSLEQADPLQALLVRMAFLATHDVRDWDGYHFDPFSANFHVSPESIQAWLGKSRCVLVIDEMNNATKLLEKCAEGTAFGQFLRTTFLFPKRRLLLFSSHVVTMVSQFRDIVEASYSQRDVLVERLPEIYSLEIAETTFDQSYTTQQLVYYGLIPALVLTRSPTVPSWIAKGEAKFGDDVLRAVFFSFFNADATMVHPEFLPFMDTIGHGKVLWIMSQMHMIFRGLVDHGRMAATPMGRQLKDLCELMANFADPKYQSGDGFEFLFAFTFLLRVGAGFPCEPFFPNFSFEPASWSFSYNKFLKSEIPLCDLTTWAELKKEIRPPKNVTFPHVAYYLPLHARFEKYDGFACMYTNVKECTTLAFQLKTGKDTAKKNVDEPELKNNAFLVRGWPAEQHNFIRGWHFISKDQLTEFFGQSGGAWLPEKLEALKRKPKDKALSQGLPKEHKRRKKQG